MKRKIELTAPLGFLLLHELRRPASGSELAHRIGKRRDAPLTPGTIYPALKDLHRKKLVQYRSQGREKIYQLRPAGEEELEKLYRDFARMFWGLKQYIRKDWVYD